MNYLPKDTPIYKGQTEKPVRLVMKNLENFAPFKAQVQRVKPIIGDENVSITVLGYLTLLLRHLYKMQDEIRHSLTTNLEEIQIL